MSNKKETGSEENPPRKNAPGPRARMAMLTAMAPDWSPRRVLEHLRELGLRQVEWATQYPPGKLPVTAPWHLDFTPRTGNIEIIRDLCREFEFEVACLSGPQSLDDKEGGSLLLEAASALRSRMVRLSAPIYREGSSAREVLRQVSAALGRWTPLARERGIKILVETHSGNVTCSPELALRVMEEFDPHDVGVILDPANMVIEGMLSWKLAISLLGPYLAHVHVKNLGWFRTAAKEWQFEYMSLQDGMVDWPKVIEALETAGYQGLYSFEDFRGGYCCLPQGIRTEDKIREDVAFLTNVLGITQVHGSVFKGSAVGQI
ncbi:MAG: sugar phosphate isomerase/epimerase [Verrucomicrobia bacterium]|nr:sugar phosphate isomerase/epimerase [Verrucomicrobiota bacterium]